MTTYQFSLSNMTVNTDHSVRPELGTYNVAWPTIATKSPEIIPHPRQRSLDTSLRFSTAPETLAGADQAAFTATAINSSVFSLELKVKSLTREVNRLTELRENLIAEAAGDPVAMFILHKVIEAEDLSLDVFVQNLTAPYGWLSFARLWRAGLIDCYGDFVMPTDAGVNLTKRHMIVSTADAPAE